MSHLFNSVLSYSVHTASKVHVVRAINHYYIQRTEVSRQVYCKTKRSPTITTMGFILMRLARAAYLSVVVRLNSHLP